MIGAEVSPVRVVVATVDDIPAWVELAREIEPQFGPMIGDPAFHASLRRCVDRGSAYCVRGGDARPGSPLIGGLLFSPKPPTYKLGWLAVTSSWRRHGIGRALVTHAIGLIQPPAELSVVTFGEDSEHGRVARRFYESFGLSPAELAPRGSEGGSRQVYRRLFV